MRAATGLVEESRRERRVAEAPPSAPSTAAAARTRSPSALPLPRARHRARARARRHRDRGRQPPTSSAQTSLQQLLSGAAIIALLAIGETIVIVTRNVDLSIGSVLGISAYAVGMLFEHHPHVPLRGRLPARRSAIGLACGIVNGAIVTIARVPSLVVTLGTLYVIRGIDGALGRRPPGRRLGCRTASTRSATGRSSAFRTSGIVAIVAVAIATYAMRTLPHGARPLRDRLEPRGCAARRHPGRRARLPRVRAQRRASPGVAGVFWLSLTARSTRSPARATSSR